MSDQKSKLSIILPLRDEPYAETLVRLILNFIEEQHEIIIVRKDKRDYDLPYDCLKIHDQKSDGLSKAIAEGIELSSGDRILVMDGDGSHRATDIPKFLKKMEECDLILGSRYADGGKSFDSLGRKFITGCFNSLANHVLGLHLSDPMSGFCYFRRKVYESLTFNPSGYKIFLEMAYKAKRRGFKIGEVPITFEKRTAGKSKTSIALGFSTLGLIFKLRLGLI